VNPANKTFQAPTIQESPGSTLISADNWEAELQDTMTADPAFKAYILKIVESTGGTPRPPANEDAAKGSDRGEYHDHFKRRYCSLEATLRNRKWGKVKQKSKKNPKRQSEGEREKP
jgi:hypothetical protein